MSKKYLVLPLTIILVFSCFKKSEGLKQTEIPILINSFLAMHVRYDTLNDELSERTLVNFINILDYGKIYFYESDIKDFDKYRHTIDDLLKSNRYDFIDDIYSVYLKRTRESMNIYKKLITLKYDFNMDEKIIVDVDAIEYPGNKDEMRERWRKSIKLQLLNYISAGKSVNEAKKKLTKKYNLIQKRVEDQDRSDVLEKFVNAFSMSLDPHSNYLSKDDLEDFAISMELKLEGIGARLRSEDGFVIVDAIIPGGAADKLPEGKKLKPNDKIIAVAQGDGDYVDTIDMDLRDAVKLIRGDRGTRVRLLVLRQIGNEDDTQRLEIEIIREEIKLEDSDAESDYRVINLNGSSKKIGYIRLPSFYYDDRGQKSSYLDVMNHLNRLKGKNVDGIILDLRGNPGGALFESIKVSGLFVDGPILQTLSRRDSIRVEEDEDNGITYRGPLVVMINKFSASASEILAGAIKDYKRGLIVGASNSFGKGTVQKLLPLSGGKKGAIKITLSIFYQPSGTSNQFYGIEPHVTVPDMSSIWEIGESETKYPLKWKKINTADYTSFNMVNNAIVNRLRAGSDTRIRNDEKFKNLIERIEKVKKQLSTRSISLKEESKIEKQKEKVLKDNFSKDNGDIVIDLENDLFLKETFNITHDYIRALGK